MMFMITILNWWPSPSWVGGGPPPNHKKKLTTRDLFCKILNNLAIVLVFGLSISPQSSVVPHPDK